MRGLRRFLRGAGVFLLILFLYLWTGAAFKLIYGLARERSTQQQGFLREAFQNNYFFLFLPYLPLRLPRLFGADFQRYLGTSWPIGGMEQWLETRIPEMMSVPEEWPDSLWADNALADVALGDMFRRREEPSQVQGVALLFSAAQQWQWQPISVADTPSLQAMQRLVNEYPESLLAPRLLSLLGSWQLQRFEFARARELSQQLVRQYPEAREALALARQLAQEAADRGRFQEAIALLERVVQKANPAPREPAAGNRSRSAAEAVDPTLFFERFQLAQDHLTLAEYALELHQRDEARRHLEEAAAAWARAEAERSQADRPMSRPRRGRPEWSPDIEQQRKQFEARMAPIQQRLWLEDLYQDLAVTPPPAPSASQELGVQVVGRVRRGETPLADMQVGLMLPGLPPRSDLFVRTDSHGKFVIRDVSPGSYWLTVVGDLEKVGPDVVLVKAPAPVVVEKKKVTLPDVILVPAVRPLTAATVLPERHQTLRLRWEPYPGAASYEVALRPDWAGFNPSGLGGPGLPSLTAQREAPGVWRRADLKEPQVSIPLQELPQPPGRWRRGEKGTTYQWVVYAYDQEGHVLSTSESYAEGGWRKVTLAEKKGQP